MSALLISVLLLVNAVAQLRRRLPLQNIFTALFIATGAASAVEIFNGWTGFAFGKSIWQKNAMAELLSWQLLLFWLALIFSSRELARWILRSRRETENYGLWLIALAAGINALLWTMGELLQHIPLNVSLLKFFAGKFLGGLFVLAMIFPWMIQKRPASRLH